MDGLCRRAAADDGRGAQVRPRPGDHLDHLRHQVPVAPPGSLEVVDLHGQIRARADFEGLMEGVEDVLRL